MSNYLDSFAASEGNSAYSALPVNVHMVGSILHVVCTIGWNNTKTMHKVWAYFDLKKNGVTVANFGKAKTLDVDSLSGTFTADITQDLSTLGSADCTGTLVISELGFVYTDSTREIITGTDPLYTFDFFNYAPPAISSFAVNRCQSDGTDDDSGVYVEATVQFSASSIGSNNELSLEIYRKLASASEWTLDKTVDISSLGYSGTSGPTVLSLTYSADDAYNLKAVLTDIANTASNIKNIAAAFSMGETDSFTHQESRGKRLDSGSPSPGEDIGWPVRYRDTVNFDVAPIVATSQLSALLATVRPTCTLYNPTKENVTVGSNRCWFPSFQNVKRNDNDAFGILLGGSTGTRKIGFVIPADGVYRVIYLIRLVDGTAASKMCMRFFRFSSAWNPPAANYLYEATAIADLSFLESMLNLIPAWSTTNTCGEFVYDFYANAGDKIWPTFYHAETTKNIEVDSFATIERIG